MLLDRKRPDDFWFSPPRIQLAAMLNRCGVDLVIDVGANDGGFLRQVRSFYSGPIISFEPVPAIYNKLVVRAAQDPNWRGFNLALGSKESTASINVSHQAGGGFSSLLKPNRFSTEHIPELRACTVETISVKRLDQVLTSLDSQRMFLKMDTQGYDLEVFKGAGDLLSQIVLLQSELSLIPVYDGMPHWIESLSVYEKAGFYVVGMFPLIRHEGRVIEYDCLMARDITFPQPHHRQE